jgi:hypothetical protein
MTIATTRTTRLMITDATSNGAPKDLLLATILIGD